MTEITPEVPAHVHVWQELPVVEPVYRWKCACGESVNLPWLAEYAGLGFNDIRRMVERDYGGTVVPYRDPEPPFTDEQAAEFARRLSELGPSRAVPRPRPLLTPETARELLRECVTVVKPGEVLLIRVPDTWSQRQAHECQQRIGEIIAERGLDLAVLLLPGEEFAVAKAKEES